MPILYRRSRPALVLAGVSSVVSLGLGAGPMLWKGYYDPTLAVLTATLIAIIWYTYLTFRVAIKEQEVRVITAVGADRGNRTVNFVYRNLSPVRTIRLLPFANASRNGKSLTLPMPLSATRPDQVLLQPGEQWELNVPVDPPLPVPGSAYGSAVQLGELEEFGVEVGAAWEDDLGERGYTGPLVYAIHVIDVRARPVVARGEANRFALDLTPTFLKQATRRFDK